MNESGGDDHDDKEVDDETDANHTIMMVKSMLTWLMVVMVIGDW